jgi:hypothetical protein
LPVLDDPSLSPEVIAVARMIETSTTGREADAAGHLLACRIAEAMIDLKRVRLAKLPLVTALHADARDFRALVQLSRLDRYERSALARRAKRSQPRKANEFKRPIARMEPSAMRGLPSRPARASSAEQSRSAPGHRQNADLAKQSQVEERCSFTGCKIVPAPRRQSRFGRTKPIVTASRRYHRGPGRPAADTFGACAGDQFGGTTQNHHSLKYH